MKTLENDIAEIIKQNLPEKVGAELKKELDELARLRVRVTELEKSNEQLTDKITELTALKLKASELDNREKALNDRELVLKDAEKDNKITLLEERLKVNDDKAQFCKDVALGLVRNTSYRSTVFDQRDIPFIDNQGHSHYANTTIHHTEEKTEN